MSALPDSFRHRSSFQKRSDSPRKVRGGIKLAGTLINSATTDESSGAALGRQFQSTWDAALDQNSRSAGLEYAKAGQIMDMEIRAGVVEARVQGTLPKPYTVQLHMPVLSAEQWGQAINVMSGEAVYVAKLLAGELPAAIHERLQQAGLSLLPASADSLTATCTCPAAAQSSNVAGARCKHVAAVVYVAAERLAAEPLLVFAMLGMTSNELLERLRQARAVKRESMAEEAHDVMLLDGSMQAPPLEACVDEFWRSPVRGDEWDQLQNSLSRHYAPHALLRRLGPSPMSGRFPLVGLLASVYDTVAAAALRLRGDADSNDPVTDRDPTN